MTKHVMSFVACLVLIFAPCKSPLAASDNKNLHISAIAEFFAVQVYPRNKSHKAIAVGPGGYWGETSGSSSAAKATQSALEGCNAFMWRTGGKSLAKRRCVLFDVDGKRTGEAPPIGDQLDAIAQGPDKPLIMGWNWNPSGSESHGILVLLHGCNQIHNIGGWVYAWVSYYQAAGFRVFMPNSFADARDQELCGTPSESSIDRQTRILKLRIAQTRRTLSNLRKQYPGEPIFVHGHSEGGYVAQALGESVAGIIVTGAPCGIGDAKAYSAPADVRVLVIAGTADPYVTDAKSNKRLQAYCKTVKGDGKLLAVSVKGMGHFAAIWRAEVDAAISKMLNVPAMPVSRRTVTLAAAPAIKQSVLEGYGKASSPKALAIGIDNSGKWNDAYSWTSSEESRLDAEESALFDCDQVMYANPFKDKTHQHRCILYDVDGKRVLN
jgi:poly(3-hydroxybutyrate) depolymerase